MRTQTRIETHVPADSLSQAMTKTRDRGNGNRLDHNDLEVIAQLREGGMPCAQIADMLHIDRSSVYRALSRM